MSHSRYDFAVVIYAEDSSSYGYDTLSRIMERSVRYLDDQSRPERIEFKGYPEAYDELVNANGWKSKKQPKKKRKKGEPARATLVDMVRDLATTIARDDHFVVFHVDADRTWSELTHRGQVDFGQSENYSEFHARLVTLLRQLLEGRGARRRQAAPEDAQRLIQERFFLMMPVYSIESWLYQNTTVALKILRKRGGKRLVEDTALLRQWCEDRQLLDDVDKPKNATSLGACHNDTLSASGFPTAALVQAGRSFFAFVFTLASSAPFRQALESTRR